MSDSYFVALITGYPIRLVKQISKHVNSNSNTDWTDLLSTESSGVRWHEGKRDTSVSILGKKIPECVSICSQSGKLQFQSNICTMIRQE